MSFTLITQKHSRQKNSRKAQRNSLRHLQHQANVHHKLIVEQKKKMLPPSRGRVSDVCFTTWFTAVPGSLQPTESLTGNNIVGCGE